MVVSNAQKVRIKQELIAAGMTNYGLTKGEARHLPSIMHEDEHVGGVIYGRYKKGTVMIVATNKRMLFLDHILFFLRNEEIAYDVVGGVSYNDQGLFAGVVVHSRMGDYSLRFVNRACAIKFRKYVEKRRIENPNNNVLQPQVFTPSANGATKALITKQAKVFLYSHNLATFSSADKAGQVAGAVVYYILAPDDVFYIVTKAQTKKATNIIDNNRVALTVHDDQMLQTAQIQGVAGVESRAQNAKDILDKIIKPHIYNKEAAWPPITRLTAGAYQVIRITPTKVKFTDFRINPKAS